MKTIKLRIYYHWDTIVNENEVEIITKKFLKRNIPNDNKDVYYMVEEVKKTKEEESRFFYNK